jgi:hypothetical protein
MMYAPRAIRHFSLAAMEGRAERATPRTLPRPVPPPVPAPDAHRATRRVVVRLWLPTTLIFLLLAPFALLLAPLLYFAPRPYGDRPWATVLAVGHVLLSLSGTVVEVEAPDTLVHIRTF